MEYVYAAMLLNAAGKEVTEENLTSVIKASGLTPDEAKVKSVVSSLKGVDIKSIIENASTMQAQPAASAAAPSEKKAEKPKAEKSEEKSEDEAAGGLAGLFG